MSSPEITSELGMRSERVTAGNKDNNIHYEKGGKERS